MIIRRYFYEETSHDKIDSLLWKGAVRTITKFSLNMRVQVLV
jgi:hypothetical protein